MPLSPKSPTPSVTAKPAPALTPRMPGSASGFRVSAWMSAPATPNAPPTTTPTSVRGTRSSQTMSEASVASLALSPAQTSAAGIGLDPCERLSATSAARAASAARTTATPAPRRSPGGRRIAGAASVTASGVPAAVGATVGSTAVGRPADGFTIMQAGQSSESVLDVRFAGPIGQCIERPRDAQDARAATQRPDRTVLSAFVLLADDGDV